jgi:hypothetical protein
MRRIFGKSALLLLGLAFVPVSGQAPAQQPAQAQQAAQAQQPTAPAPQAAVSGQQQAVAQPVVLSMQPLSQPGAKGQIHAATVPPVPVPPGPVAASGIKPAPPTPIAVKKVELQEDDPWDPQWDVVIEENLPPELLSPEVARDVRPFCPHFNVLPEADKRAFWAYFFQALAGAEAGLKPTTDVRHMDPSVAIVDPVTHRITRQEGLLQLKYLDSQRYGCDFDWEHDKHLPVHDPDKTILQPENNLLCGIHILTNQLIGLHEPLLTRKSYWATLRPGTISYRVFARQMANVPEACGQGTVHHRHLTEPPLREALFGGSQTPAPASFQSQR